MDTETYDKLAEAARATDNVLLTRRALELGLTDWDYRRLVRQAREAHLPKGCLLLPPADRTLQARARAAQLLVPDGVLCGRTAARMHGLQGLDECDDEPLEVNLPGRTRWQRSGLKLHFRGLAEDDVTEVDGLRVTTPLRTLLDLEAELPVTTFVCLADNAVNKSLVSDEEVAALIRDRPQESADRWRRVDGLSESPSETLVRLVLVDDGLVPDALQLQVRDETGRIIARLDMAWKRRRPVGLEVDSSEHDRPTALYRDRYRQNDLEDLGWTMRRFTSWDARNRPAYIRQVMRRALAA